MSENKFLVLVCVGFLAIVVFVSLFYYLPNLWATQFRCADGSLISIPMICK